MCQLLVLPVSKHIDLGVFGSGQSCRSQVRSSDRVHIIGFDKNWSNFKGEVHELSHNQNSSTL